MTKFSEKTSLTHAVFGFTEYQVYIGFRIKKNYKIFQKILHIYIDILFQMLFNCRLENSEDKERVNGKDE